MSDLNAARKNAGPLTYWRVVFSDSESLDALAPICHSAEHGRLPDGTRDEDGTYDCCPEPFIEVHDGHLAAYLVALLNADTESAT